METIEIGAVKLDQHLAQVDEFTTFIKPVIHPQLSEFCVMFTSIQQSDVDSAELLPAAFKRFFDWIGPDPFIWYSWSHYDRDRLVWDLEFHNQPIPPEILNHKDLKKLYAEHEGLEKQVGMRRALKNLEIPFEGRQHRGIDDAKNTAEILRYLLKGQSSGKTES